jgi:hypothetical protein
MFIRNLPEISARVYVTLPVPPATVDLQLVGSAFLPNADTATNSRIVHPITYNGMLTFFRQDFLDTDISAYFNYIPGNDTREIIAIFSPLESGDPISFSIAYETTV